MAVKHEIKSQLAKLLATEDLIVEHRHCETAQFNVHTRVLTLPMWEKASNTVYDLLVGHEVGHALFTPEDDWNKTYPKLPHQYVNIIEDIRIEKQMKRKYPGLAKTFYNGYSELSDQDFFSLEDEDVSTFTLADRINLHSKIGNFIDIKFSDKEKEIVALCENCYTFADVLIAAQELYKFCKDQQQDLQSQSASVQSNGQQSSEQQEQGDQEQEQSSSNEGSSLDREDQEEGGEVTPDVQKSTTKNPQGGKDQDPEIRTVDSLEESIRDLVNQHSAENTYVEIPDSLDIGAVIAKNSEIHEHCDERFALYQEKEEDKSFNIYAKVDRLFYEFKKSAQKEVNYLVKEFECKKSADQYARSSTARTGVLDCTKLHTYKYNEDLFRKITVLPDGKNHGLVFILDWSGSMAPVLTDTIKQLYNLIWFCKKVNIPFDVYAFTNEWNKPYFDPVTQKYTEYPEFPVKEKVEGEFIIDKDFSLMNILTSNVNGKVLEKQLINIWRIAQYFSNRYVGYDIPWRLALSGTPLNESLICLHKLLPEFQKRNKVQKVQCVILTDGEAPALNYWKERTYTSFHSPTRETITELGSSYVNGHNTIIRDRKTGNTYALDHTYTSLTDNLLYQLRNRFTNVNFIGIRVIAPREAGRFIDLNRGSNNLKEIFRKEKACLITTSGYHAYFAISSTSLAQDTEFDVDEGASKAKIKSAFVKSLKTKKLNKKVLGEFISLVA